MVIIFGVPMDIKTKQEKLKEIYDGFEISVGDVNRMIREIDLFLLLFHEGLEFLHLLHSQSLKLVVDLLGHVTHL